MDPSAPVSSALPLFPTQQRQRSASVVSAESASCGSTHSAVTAPSFRFGARPAALSPASACMPSFDSLPSLGSAVDRKVSPTSSVLSGGIRWSPRNSPPRDPKAPRAPSSLRNDIARSSSTRASNVMGGRPAAHFRGRSFTDPVNPVPNDLQVALLGDTNGDSCGDELKLSMSRPVIQAPDLVKLQGVPSCHETIHEASCESDHGTRFTPLPSPSFTPTKKLDEVSLAIVPLLDKPPTKPSKLLRVPFLQWPTVWRYMHRGSIILHFLALIMFANLLLTYLPGLISAISEIRTTIARLDIYLDILDDLFGHSTRTAADRAEIERSLINGGFTSLKDVIAQLRLGQPAA